MTSGGTETDGPPTAGDGPPTAGDGPPRVGVAIPAAGGGRRMGGVAKPLLQLRGEPVLLWAIRPFLALPEVTSIVIALSADHGGPEAPEYAQSIGMQTGRFSFDHFKQPNELNAPLKKRYGRDDFILSHSHPYLYLDYDAIRDAKQDPAQVERFVAAEATKIPGIRYAMSRSELIDGRYADAPIQRMIRRNFHPDRSGAVHLVQDQYWFLHSTDEAAKMGLSGLAAIHGSPWSYDTYVPIFFAGHTVPAQRITRRVETTDLAPTIAAYLEIKPPSGSIGDPLEEVLGHD